MDCIIMAIVCKNKILLQKRDNKPNIKYPGYWALPGGGIEVGETPDEALVREFREEIIKPVGTECFFEKIGVISNEWNALEHIFIAYIDNDKNVRCIEGERSEFLNINDVMSSCELPPHHRNVFLLINEFVDKQIEV